MAGRAEWPPLLLPGGKGDKASARQQAAPSEKLPRLKKSRSKGQQRGAGAAERAEVRPIAETAREGSKAEVA